MFSFLMGNEVDRFWLLPVVTQFSNSWFISKFELNFDDQSIYIKQKSTAATTKIEITFLRILIIPYLILLFYL